MRNPLWRQGIIFEIKCKTIPRGFSKIDPVTQKKWSLIKVFGVGADK